MSVTVTVQELAVSLGVAASVSDGQDPPTYTVTVPHDQAEILARLLATATELVNARAPLAPDEVQNEAAVRLVAWFYDTDPAQLSSGGDPLLHSGAGAVLAPWRRHRLVGAPDSVTPTPTPGPGPDDTATWARIGNTDVIPSVKLPAGDVDGIQLNADGDLVVIPRRGAEKTIPLPHVPTAYIRSLDSFGVTAANELVVNFHDGGGQKLIALSKSALKQAVDAAGVDSAGVKSIQGLSQNSGRLFFMWTDAAGDPQTSFLSAASIVELLQDAGVNPVSTIGDPSGTKADGLKFTWDNFLGRGHDVQFTPAMVQAALGKVFGTGIEIEAIASGLQATLSLSDGTETHDTQDWATLAGYIAQHESVSLPPVKLFGLTRVSATKYTFNAGNAVALKAAWTKYKFIDVVVMSARGHGIFVNTQREAHSVFPTLKRIPFESFGSQSQDWAENQVSTLFDGIGNVYVALKWNSGNPGSFAAATEMGQVNFGGDGNPDAWTRQGDGHGPYRPSVEIWAY